MSEETKNTAPQPQEPETAPAAEPVKEAQTAETPAAEEQDDPHHSGYIGNGSERRLHR